MRFVTGIFFLALYLVAMTRPVIPYLDYVINKDYIVKNLCINRDKPKSCCEGKCYLTKELNKASDSRPIPLDDGKVRIETEKFPFAVISELKLNIVEQTDYRSEFFVYHSGYVSEDAETTSPPPRPFS